MYYGIAQRGEQGIMWKSWGKTAEEADIESVIERYGDLVFKLALTKTQNKENAEDIFQEVFLRFIKKKNKFTDDNHEKAWLIRVTINCCNDLWKSAWIRHTVPLEPHLKRDGEYGEVSEVSDVFEMVMQLPDIYKIPVHLYYYEDLSIEEIGKVLKIKKNTIATRLKRARQILKNNLMDGGEYERF